MNVPSIDSVKVTSSFIIQRSVIGPISYSVVVVILTGRFSNRVPVIV